MIRSFKTSVVGMALVAVGSPLWGAEAKQAPTVPAASATSSAQSAPASQQQPVINPKIIMLRWFVADVERATRFYQSVFGMTVLQQMGAKVRVMGFPGGSMPGLILIESAEEARMNGSFIILVGNVQDTLARAAAAGGTLMNTKFAQKIDGVQASSSHFTDPDGNVVEVLQMPGAKP